MAAQDRFDARETVSGIDPMHRPIDIPTRETADFLASHLQSSSTLLEVGCGDGDVAAELARRGHRCADRKTGSQPRGASCRSVAVLSQPEDGLELCPAAAGRRFALGQGLEDSFGPSAVRWA
jgi:hypothetical protein